MKQLLLTNKEEPYYDLKLLEQSLLVSLHEISKGENTTMALSLMIQATCRYARTNGFGIEVLAAYDTISGNKDDFKAIEYFCRVYKEKYSRMQDSKLREIKRSLEFANEATSNPEFLKELEAVEFAIQLNKRL